MERGFTLIEALLAILLLAIAGGVLAAAASTAKFAAAPAGANRMAALAVGEATVRVAQDVWKYGVPTGTLVPSGSWSTVSADGVTLGVTAAVTAAGDLQVKVTYPPDTPRDESGSITLHTTLHVLAPRPRERVVRPGLIAAPPAAP